MQGKNLTGFDKVLIISIIIKRLRTHHAEENDLMAKEEEGPAAAGSGMINST